MRKLLPPAVIAVLTIASSAHAADLPPKAISPVFADPIIGFNWTGAYAGVNVGYGVADDLLQSSSATNRRDGTAEAISLLKLDRVRVREDGFVGGGQVGYNYQLTPGSGAVVGLEADAQYAGLRKSYRAAYAYAVPGETANFTADLSGRAKNGIDFLGTLRGRVGYGFDRVLVYGTAGLAYGDVGYRDDLTATYRLTNAAGAALGQVSGSYDAKSNHMQVGYAYGAGVEYAIPTDSLLNFFSASAVTVRGEYLHYDLGSRVVIGNVRSSSPNYTPSATATKIRNEGDVFRAALNYKFGVF